MAKPVELLSRYNPSHKEEGSVHFFAREGRTIMVWTVGVLLVVTVVTMVTFYFWAIIPATLLLIAYLGLMATEMVEHRARGTRIDRHQNRSAEAIREDLEAEQEPEVRSVPEDAPEWKKPNFRMALLKHETLLLSIVVGVMVVTAAVVATILFDWRIVLIAIPFVAAYMLLLSSPAWFAAVEDEADEELHPIAGPPRNTTQVPPAPPEHAQ